MIRLPFIIAVDAALLALDVAATLYAAAVCRVVGHDGQWHPTSIGPVRWCERCGAS